jgi:hypothetical protein
MTDDGLSIRPSPNRCCPEMDVHRGTCLACWHVHTPDPPREAALANVRDALAAVHEIPVAGVDDQKAATVRAVADDLGALEAQLANEVEQLREDDDG